MGGEVTQFRSWSSGPSMFRRPLPWMLVLLALGPGGSSPATAADAMRCGSRLVAVEAHAAEVLAACGEPSFRDVFSYPAPRGTGVIADAEQWTYNFGPNKLLHVLHLRNGRLTDIRTQGYGFHASAARRCTPTTRIDGLGKYRLLATCGEPLTRRTVGYVTAGPVGGGWRPHGHRHPVEVFREEWIYNFGRRYLMKILTLEDGVVVDVENGERGFDT